MLFHHDKAKRNMARITLLEEISEINGEFLPHPPFSPYIPQRDFHLFHAQKNVLPGKKLNFKHEVQIVLEIFMQQNLFLQSFYSNGI